MGGGMTDAFLGHSQISGEERQCLSKGASSFAGSLTGICEQALETYKQFTAPALAPAPRMVAPQFAAGVPASNYAATSAAGTPAINPFAPAAPAAVPATPVVPTDMIT